MWNRKWSAWLSPEPTGDPGRDRNARTLQFSCILLACAIGAVAVMDFLGQGPQETHLLASAVVGLVAAAALNRAGKSDWAARTAFVAVLLTATLLVFQARDGFRSHAMLIFPGLLLISLMLLDRASYLTTASIVLVVVALLGIAERRHLTRAIPRVRSSTTYESIFFVDLHLLVIAIIGSRIARDVQRNVFDLRASVDHLSAANLELVHIKEHLQESEERLKSAQRLTHVGSWHCDLETYRVACSEECKRIFGQIDEYSPTLQEMLQIVAPRDRERVTAEIHGGIENGCGCSTEFQIARPNGDLRTITFTSQVLLHESGSPGHIFGACQDITEARRAQEAVFARQKLETVGTLANGIAHDFNNLLGAVLSQAELALSELASGARPERELKTICSVAMTGSEIVRQLMIFSGQDRAAPESVNVADTIAGMAELLRFSVSKRVALHTELAPNLPDVRATAAQIRQVVMNLVMNASEASGDAGGMVRLTLRRTSVGADRPGWIPEDLAPGNYLQLEVADTGKGMTSETQARVFDPFFTTKPLGHGLGLAVVSGVVRDLAGAIHLISEPGMGTTFRILLPCLGSSSAPAQEPDAHQAAPGEKNLATVLVVEDEETLRTAVAKVLRKSGLSVLEAADGTEALEAIQASHSIDVLLLDVTLPGAPSRDVLAEARRLRPGLRVIVTSAYGRETAAGSLEQEVEQFIRKPYSLRDLLGLIRQSLA